MTIKQDSSNASYQERQSCKNIAEERFEAYCIECEVEYHRFGFDEKQGNISNFFLIDPVLRNLPDYIIPVKNKIYFVQVKGTNKIKMKDIGDYKKFWELFGNENCHFVFYFMFNDSVIVMTLSQILEAAQTLPIKQFENDGKDYIALDI